MPVDVTEDYIWIAVRNSDTFVQDSFRQISISEDQGIGARIGKLKSDPDGSTVIQAYYFDKDKWTVSEAKEWVKDHKKSGSQGMQRRYIESISRMNFEDQRNPKIEGHAAVFNKRTEIWPGFWEEVAPGAFTEALKSEDVYALWNHDPKEVLGNTGAKTLSLSEDDKGLKYSIIPPDTTLGRDLVTLIKRGDVRKSSFGFNIKEEKIEKLDEGKIVLRTILKVQPLFDVSPVTFPAYPQTEVHVRLIQHENECLYFFEDSGQVIEVSREHKEEPLKPLSDNQLFAEFDEIMKRVNSPRKH
jgi:HK97 family phage prohead protease